MVTPCNMHINTLADETAKGADQAGGKAVIFNTITVSDGISMGTEGMKYSLVSREVIADSIETVVGCEGFDGVVAIGGCDKNMPGCLIAMARLNRPSIFVYGGTIQPGRYKNTKVDVVSVFEAVGQHAKNQLSDRELKQVECSAIPGAGFLRRDVYRQHHGQCHRGPGHEPAEQFGAKCNLERQTARLHGCGPSRHALGAKKTSAPRTS